MLTWYSLRFCHTELPNRMTFSVARDFRPCDYHSCVVTFLEISHSLMFLTLGCIPTYLGKSHNHLSGRIPRFTEVRVLYICNFYFCFYTNSVFCLTSSSPSAFLQQSKNFSTCPHIPPCVMQITRPPQCSSGVGAVEVQDSQPFHPSSTLVLKERALIMAEKRAAKDLEHGMICRQKKQSLVCCPFAEHELWRTVWRSSLRCLSRACISFVTTAPAGKYSSDKKTHQSLDAKPDKLTGHTMRWHRLVPKGSSATKRQHDGHDQEFCRRLKRYSFSLAERCQAGWVGDIWQ